MKREVEKKRNLYERYLDEGIFGTGENYSTSGLVSEIYGRVYGKKEVGTQEILETWQSFLKQKKRMGHLSLYTHIPYCYERCHYCYTTSCKLENEEDLEGYVKKLVKYYHLFKETFKNETFDNLYIGGGTPSILTEDLLELLLSELFDCFRIGKEGERTFENDPRNFSVEKLKIVKKYGINRVSFGVQSFNEEVLKLNNRVDQTEEQVKKAIAGAKKVGFDCINLDLMVGLYGEDEESIIESFKKALKLKPDSISVYTVQPVGGYLARVYNADKEEFFNHREKLMNNVMDDFLRIAESEGYHLPGIEKDIENATRNKHLNNADCLQVVKKDFEYDPATKYVSHPVYELNSILGFGRGSGSTITGRLRYEMTRPLTEDPEEYKFKGLKYDLRREMLKNVIITFSINNSMSLQKFKNKFGRSFLDEFNRSLRELKEAKIVSVDGDKINFNCEDPKERLVHLLFFFEEKDIDAYVKEVKKIKKGKKGNGRSRIKIDKTLREKIESVEGRINKNETERIEGRIVEKNNDEIVLRSEEEDFKIKTEGSLLVVEVFLREDDFQPIRKKESELKDLKKGDSLVVTICNKGPELTPFLIQKMSVVE